MNEFENWFMISGYYNDQLSMSFINMENIINTYECFAKGSSVVHGSLYVYSCIHNMHYRNTNNKSMVNIRYETPNRKTSHLIHDKYWGKVQDKETDITACEELLESRISSCRAKVTANLYWSLRT